MLKDFLKDKDQLTEALSSELANHKYYITGDMDESLESLNLSYDELNTMQKKALITAIKQQKEVLRTYK